MGIINFNILLELHECSLNRRGTVDFAIKRFRCNEHISVVAISINFEMLSYNTKPTLSLYNLC